MVFHGVLRFSYGFSMVFPGRQHLALDGSPGLFSAEAAIEARSATTGLNSVRLIRVLRLLRSRSVGGWNGMDG